MKRIATVVLMLLLLLPALAKAQLPSYYSVNSVNKLDDQSMFVVGTSGQQNDLMDFMAIKFKSDGLLDRSFGSQGVVTKDVSGNQDLAVSTVVLPDGGFIIGGMANVTSSQYPFGMYDIGLIKISSDGVVDSTFGIAGKVVQDISGHQDNLAKLLLQGDGKIIAVGGAYVSDATQMEYFVARFNADGSLDTTFNNGAGFLTTSLGPYQDEPSGALLQIDGKIVISGLSTRGGANTDFSLVRLNMDGSFDTTFGVGGIVYTDLTPSGVSQPVNEYWNKIAIQSDGKILLYGGTQQPGGMQKVVIRYFPDGSIDSSFGQNGVVNLGVGNAGDIAVLVSGDILLTAGTSDAKIKVLRLAATGVIDSSFGSSGEVEFVTQYGGNPPGIVIESGGTFSLVGNIFDQSGNTGTFIASYSSSGELFSSVMVASDSSAAFKGSEKNDSIFVGAKEKTIDGGAGIDGAAFMGNQSDYIIASVPDAVSKSSMMRSLNSELNTTFTVSHKSGAYGLKTIRNFEKLVFEDGTVNLSQVAQKSDFPWTMFLPAITREVK